MKKTVTTLAVIIMGLCLAACSASPETPTATTTAAPTNTPEPTATETPVPTPTPAPIGGGTGEILLIGLVQQEADLGNGKTLSYPVYQLEKMDLESGETEILITLDMLEEELGMELYQIRFEPSLDGSQVVISVATAISDKGPESYENYLSDPYLNTLVPILHPEAPFVKWIWSPDSTMLLGHAVFDGTQGIMIVNNDGSGLQNVIKTVSATDPVWSPDSSKIYTLVGGIPVVTNLDGSEIQVVGLENIDSLLRIFSFSPDGEKVAYLTNEGEVFLAKSDFSEGFQVDMEHNRDRDYNDPSFGSWSGDSQYVIFKDIGYIFFGGAPKFLNSDYLIRASDGKLLNPTNPGKYGSEEMCGWSPNGSLIYYKFYSEPYKLSLLEIDENRTYTSFIINFESRECPTWIQ